MKKIIDFIVQSYGVDVNTAATLTITITIFLLGIFSTLLVSYIVSSIKKHYYQVSMKLIIHDFIKSCKKQSEIHGESNKLKSMGDGTDITIKIVPNPSQLYLSQIDINEFNRNFISFFVKKRAKILSKLLELVESVKLNKEILLKTSEMTAERYSQHEAVYYSNLDELRKLNDELISEVVKPNAKENPLYSFQEEVVKCFINWQDSGGDTRISATYSEIVLKLLEIGKKSPPNKYTKSIFDYCLKCDISYINMEKLNQILIQKIGDAAYFNRRAYKIGSVIYKAL